MTTPVASPPMSIPDAGTSAKAAAASPQDDGAFGAMLAQAQGAPASPAGDAGSKAQSSNVQASGTQASGSQSASPQTPDAQATNASADTTTIPDPTTLAAAIANQVPLVAQMEAAKTPEQNQDTTAGDTTDAPVSDTGKQGFDTAKSRVATQEAAPQLGGPAVMASDSGTTPPTAQVPDANAKTTPAVAAQDVTQDTAQDTAADDESGAATLTADAATETAAQESEPAAVTLKAAPVASNTPKTEKPAHAEDDDTSTAPQAPDTSATPDLSSRVAAQLLGAPATPASQSQAKGDSKPQDVLPPGLAAAAQASASRPAPSDKNANPKAAAAANAHGASDPRSQARDTQSADANAATPAANGSEGLNRAAANISPPGEHAAQAEPVAAAPNLAPANPTIPNHAGLDVPAGGIANATPPPSNDASVPVKLSVSTPGTPDSPSFDALALKIAARSLNGENNFSVRLDPPELGRIEVNLNVRADGHAQAELSADKPQTLQLLQQDASQLERALKDAGLNLAGGLAFSLKGDGRSQTWRDTQNGSRGRSLQISATDAVSANAAIAAGSALAAHAYGLSTTRLDISV